MKKRKENDLIDFALNNPVTVAYLAYTFYKVVTKDKKPPKKVSIFKRLITMKKEHLFKFFKAFLSIYFSGFAFSYVAVSMIQFFAEYQLDKKTLIWIYSLVSTILILIGMGMAEKELPKDKESEKVYFN